MIVARTPLRVSLFGGGSDYPDHFRHHGGQTLGTAIDKFSYVTVNPLPRLFGYTIRIGYSKTELLSHVDEIQHPAVRECLRFLEIEGGVDINYVGDLPARAGLGSSSSFTVALLHALHAFKGEHASSGQLAEEAVHVEQELIRERVGVQDQYTCAHGGLLHLAFATNGAVSVSPVPLPPERLSLLQAQFMLLYTGIRRHAHEILDEQLQRTRQGLSTPDLTKLASMVSQGLEILCGDRALTPLGELLHDAWQLKRGLSSKVSNGAIDGYYDRARQAGAIGGKLLGAGGGGFLLFFVPRETQPLVARALPELVHVPFAFDWEGSRIVFYQHARA